MIAVLGLLWNGGGIANLYMQTAGVGLENLPEDYRAYIDVRPQWATIAFAVAVIAGTLGCLLMLLRNRLSPVTLFVSFIGVAVAFAHIFMAMGLSANQGFLSTLAALIVAALLYIYARSTARRGWLG